LNIDPVHSLAIKNPKALVCGDVKYGVATPHGMLERFRLGEIAGDDLTVYAGQITTVAVWTDESAHIVACSCQRTKHSRTHKTRRASQ
jgi:hypothetical protein